MTEMQVQQVQLNRRDRIVRVAAAILFGIGTVFLDDTRPVWLISVIYCMANLLFDWVDRRFLAAPSPSRLMQSIAMCLCETFFLVAAFVLILPGGSGFDLFLCTGLLWMWASHLVTECTHDMRFFWAGAILPFIAFASTVGMVDPDVIPRAMAPVCIAAAILQMAFTVHSASIAHRSKQALADARDRAQDAVRMKERFFAAISHEIRTSLNGILGIGQIMKHEAQTAPEQQRAEAILDSGTAMQSLLNDLLDQAKLEAGEFTIRPSDTSVRSVVCRATDTFSYTARSEDLWLHTEIGESVPDRIRVDATRLRQILLNLVSNAIKHTERGGITVEVTTQRGAGRDWLKILVRDTGPGIPEDMIDKVFVPFCQAGAEHGPRANGTGLGLSIARSLAEAMGGDLCAVPGMAQGACFQLRLPLKTVDAKTAPGRPSEDPSGSIGDVAGMRALIVDDNALNRRIVRSFLDLSGIEVIDARTGDEALALLDRDDDLGVVLTDLRMPGMSGETLLAKIRAHARHGLTPVICLTADDSVQLDDFDAVLAKPVVREHLSEAISAVLSARARKAA